MDPVLYAKVGPEVGVTSICGRPREMEDTLTIQPRLCFPQINRNLPLHFYAVYDGHGGRQVATLCKEKMYELVEEEILSVTNTAEDAMDSSSSEEFTPAEVEMAWEGALRSCFERIDELASHTCACACGNLEENCNCPEDLVGLIGSTAVIVVITEDTIITANCGDSRAVLSRNGGFIQLSTDHKADNPVERARIEAIGGRILFYNGAKVEGFLPIARAIGDSYLKPLLIAKPDITFTRREPGDEFIVLASVGLWDFLSTDLVCDVARQCLREDEPLLYGRTWLNGTEKFDSRSSSASAFLTRIAIGRKSRENITVIVVDLKRNYGEEQLKI